MIQIENHGPLIVGTNYWGSEMARAGMVFVSVNGGAIRILVPQSNRAWINDMRAAKQIIVSRGPWPESGKVDAVEYLFDDETDSPFLISLGPESHDFFPGEPDAGREWIVSVWDEKKGRPHKAMERIAHWRRVARIPYMKRWGE